jgi:hypothetical protein
MLDVGLQRSGLGKVMGTTSAVRMLWLFIIEIRHLYPLESKRPKPVLDLM